MGWGEQEAFSDKGMFVPLHPCNILSHQLVWLVQVQVNLGRYSKGREEHSLLVVPLLPITTSCLAHKAPQGLPHSCPISVHPFTSFFIQPQSISSGGACTGSAFHADSPAVCIAMHLQHQQHEPSPAEKEIMPSAERPHRVGRLILV